MFPNASSFKNHCNVFFLSFRNALYPGFSVMHHSRNLNEHNSVQYHLGVNESALSSHIIYLGDDPLHIEASLYHSQTYNRGYNNPGIKLFLLTPPLIQYWLCANGGLDTELDAKMIILTVKLNFQYIPNVILGLQHAIHLFISAWYCTMSISIFWHRIIFANTVLDDLHMTGTLKATAQSIFHALKIATIQWSRKTKNLYCEFAVPHDLNVQASKN